jgi:hypothetical protein
VGNALRGATAIGQAISAIDPGNRSTGYVEQFSFDVQRQIDNSDAVSAGYTRSHTLKQPYNMALNELNPAYYALGNP